MESAIVASANQSSPSPFAMVHRPGPSGNALEGVGLKYWRAIPGDYGNEEAGGILVDGAHGRWPRRSLGPQIIILAGGAFSDRRKPFRKSEQPRFFHSFKRGWYDSSRASL